MSLLFIDGCDHVAYADLAVKYNVVASSSYVAIDTGRNGNCIRIKYSENGYVRKNINGNKSTLVIGVAFKVTSLNCNLGYGIINIQDGSSKQCYLAISNGLLQIYGSGSTNLLVTSTKSILINTWYYLEWKVTIADSAPAHSCVVKINGETWIDNASIIDTKQTANAYTNSLVFFGTGSSTDYIYFDDIYICDNLNGVNDDFLGEGKVVTLLPNGNGNTSNFTGSDANSTDNYLLVDETTPNTSDYVESSTVDHVDLYTYPDLPAGPTAIKGVQLNLYAEKTDAGARTIAPVIRASGTDTPLTTVSPSAGSYAYFSEVKETQPGGSSAWTESAVNAAEFGIKVIA